MTNQITTTDEQIKSQAITDLYRSGIIQNKIKGFNFRYNIPIETQIEEDVLHHVFEKLIKYDTAKFVDAYLDNPNRIVALATRLLCLYAYSKDKRSQAWWRNSLAQDLVHGIGATTSQSYDFFTSNNNDDYSYSIDEEEEQIQQRDQEHINQRITLTKLTYYLTEEENHFYQQYLKNPSFIYQSNENKKMYRRLINKLKKIKDKIQEPMTNEERHQIINQLLHYLYQHRNNQAPVFGYEDGQKLKRVYADIYNIYTINVTCASCILHYLSMLEAWKEGNPLPQPEPQPEPEQEVVTTKKKKK